MAQIKIGQLNAISIYGAHKAAQVRKFIQDKGLDALAICETKIKHSDSREVKQKALPN